MYTDDWTIVEGETVRAIELLGATGGQAKDTTRPYLKARNAERFMVRLSGGKEIDVRVGHNGRLSIGVSQW